MTVARLKTIAYLAIPVLAVGDLGVDIITPLGITDWVWYVIPLLFTIYVGGRSLPFVLAAALSILSMVGFFFSPPGVDPHWALSSRLAGIVVLWLVALMIWHRKQTVAALARERLLLRKLIDNLPDLVFVKDPQSRFIVTNTACAQQLGASRPEEVLGKSDADFVTPELAAQYRADEQALMQSGQPVHKEERTEHKTLGEMRWSLTTKIPLKDDAGNVVGLMGIARDITERKQADEALLLSKQRLALHVEQTPLAVIQWDSDFKVQEWNPAAEKVFGYTQEEAVGRHFGFFISDSARPQVEAVGLTLIKRGGSQRSTNENITKTGKTIICEWFNTALVDPAGRFMGVASLVQDITEHKQAEEALHQTHNELEKRVAERTAELSQERRLLRTLIDNLPDCIYAKDAAGRKTMANAADLKNLRCKTEAEAFGKSDYDFFPKDIAEKFWADDQKVIQGEPVINREELSVNDEGEKYWQLTTKLPLHDQDGKIVGLMGIGRNITEQKQAEEALRQSRDELEKRVAERTAELAQERRLLRTLIDNLPDCIYAKDTAGRKTMTNPADLKIMGCKTEAEAIGKSDFDFFPKDIAEQFWANDQKVIQGQPVINREEFFLDEKGEKRWLLTSKLPLRDQTGKIVGLMGIGRDVTERKQAEESFTAQQRLLDNLITAIPDLIYFKDRESRFIRINEAYALRQGLADIHAALGKTDFDIFGDQHARQAHEDEQRIMATGQPLIDKEEREDWKDGHVTWVSSTKLPMRDGTGKIVGIMGISRDITERKKAEQQLAEALNFNQKIISGATLGMLVYKASGQCVLANEAAARTVNGTVPQLLSQDFRQIVSWRTSDLLKIAELALATGKPQQVETHFVSTFGKEIWLEAHFTSFMQGNEPHLLFIFNDITERKKLEAQFLRAQRLESIGTLASGIAHDLNNVLTPLLISVQVLKEKVADEDGRRLLQSLEVNVQRGASLVKQVLAFGRGIEGERVMVYPAHVVREIKQIVHETFPKSVEFELHSPADLWTIIGDPTQLHQVLLNLCVNARDAMPNGGKLSIHMENATFDETYAGMELESKPGPYVAISVADTGTGIPKEIRDKIFDPFFSTKAPGKGTGLGLSTTLAIVKSHGGFIHCHSEPGKGTTFKAYFPANNVPAVVEKLSVEESKLPRGHNELVLVVDDEEPIRILVQKALEHFGYRVLLAADGVEAVSLYRSHQKEIDVVITDIVMPIMDGTTTIAVLKNINPDVRIVTSSGLASEGGMTRARNAGARCFIPKPYTAETMLNTLHEVLSGN